MSCKDSKSNSQTTKTMTRLPRYQIKMIDKELENLKSTKSGSKTYSRPFARIVWQRLCQAKAKRVGDTVLISNNNRYEFITEETKVKIRTSKTQENEQLDFEKALYEHIKPEKQMRPAKGRVVRTMRQEAATILRLAMK